MGIPGDFTPTNASSYFRALLAETLVGIDASCSEVHPRWSQTPAFDDFVKYRGYDMLTDVHQLKTKLFCLEKPGFAIGNFDGHVIPGLLFIMANMVYMWVIFSRYYKSVYDETYKFVGTVGRGAVPFCKRAVPVTAITLSLQVPHILFSALTHAHGDTVWLSTWYERAWDYFTTDPHISMLSLFLLAAIVDVIEPRKRLGLKRNTSHFLFSSAYFTLTLAILFHGFSPKCAYSGRVHIVFILIPCIFTTLSMFAVLGNPSSFFRSFSAAFWGCMVGIGYVMTGFLCFPIKWLEECIDSDHPSVKIGKVPAQFLLSFAYFGIIVFAGFMLFGACRGRRLGKMNPDYYIPDQGALLYQEDEECSSLLAHEKKPPSVCGCP